MSGEVEFKETPVQFDFKSFVLKAIELLVFIWYHYPDRFGHCLLYQY